ncbi:Uncharacterised protein [Vibrio vulnificus]|uniref:hypothetical protein n=1 Tax=Vibrio vulnificus TaxID=672 RepID=UPI0001F5C42D|nr:hypothetical protein [Vibrio vulnificus]ADV86368.1 hypothetical protein VVMO6_01346 [Vibrio vulnificus MO6-24/O]EGR0040872.1 hypothetical protein [Vibrio vulnificus]EGR0093354.1 hypothetical protein [Vibrio vulnificus]EGR0097862.1 hypothetical protein [Vibrio vulnificus]EGR7945113.1 hypothetical protein [Vibrio vulnificus]
MDKFFNFVLKLIEALKPKFYNKITWLIVVCGLSLMSTPLWITIVNEIFEKTLELSITNDSDTLWGFLLCCLGLVYHLLNTGLHEVALSVTSKAALEKKELHDKLIFEQLNDIVEEDALNHILSNLRSDHSIYRNSNQSIRDFIVKATSSSSSFVCKDISEKTASLCEALTEFIYFVDEHFDTYPYTQPQDNYRMCLAPQLNCDRAGSWSDSAAYGQLAGEMEQAVNAVKLSYKVWRKIVKEKLYV